LVYIILINFKFVAPRLVIYMKPKSPIHAFAFCALYTWTLTYIYIYVVSSSYNVPWWHRRGRGVALFVLDSALDGVGGQGHAPAALPPKMTQWEFYRMLREAQGWPELVRKNSPRIRIRFLYHPSLSELRYQLR